MATTIIDGVTVIVCTRGRRPAPCRGAVGCDRPHTRLCDFPVNVPGRKSKTCDVKLCAQHAVAQGSDRDFCPAHARHVGPAQGSLPLGSKP